MHGRLTDDKEMQTRMRNDAFGTDGVHTAALCEKREKNRSPAPQEQNTPSPAQQEFLKI
jgi:hypothetical protein